jgi:hypothetical protein
VVENQKDPLLKEGHPLKELELQNLKSDIFKQNRLAYLAGLFDGEGSFGLWSVGKDRKTPQFTLQVEMRDIDLIGREISISLVAFKNFFNAVQSHIDHQDKNIIQQPTCGDAKVNKVYDVPSRC